MKYFFLLFISLCNSLTWPNFKQFNKKIGKFDIDVYEASNKENSMIFYTGANGVMPSFIYSDFLSRLSDKGVSCYSIKGGTINGEVFSWIEKHSNHTPFVAAHSSGAIPALDLASISPITNIVLLDPVGFKSYELKRIKNVLFCRASLSYDWPSTFDIPFIPAFGIDDSNFKNSNNIEFTKFTADNFGHGDILDTFWADISAKTTIIKGHPERSKQVNEKYHDLIVQHICDFLNSSKEKTVYNKDSTVSSEIVSIDQDS